MPTENDTRLCWISGAGLGLLVWILTVGPGDLNWFEGLVLALVSGVLFGAFLIWLLCRGEPAMDASHWAPPPFTGNPAVRPKKTVPAVRDDLKEIRGIGPKLEEMLNEHGISRFAQIAAWDDKEIDHFAEVIGRMGGRIRNDDWVGQARTLTAGGGTEFSKRVEEGGLY